MTKLKPCPLCGGQPNYAGTPYVGAPWGHVGLDAMGTTIVCQGCGCTIPSKVSTADAEEAWNTRAERTCRIEERNGDWYCSECGEMVGTSDTASELCIDSNAVELWRYCPNCGAMSRGGAMSRETILDDAISKAKEAGDRQLADWLRMARGGQSAARWYATKLGKLEAENIDLRNKLVDESALRVKAELESAKLRELVRFMWLADYAGHFSTLPEHQDHQATVWQRMHELGIEVE